MTDDHQRFCRISYWKRNGDGFLSSSSRDEQWDECVVGPLSTYSPYGEQRFPRGPNSDYQIQSLVSLLRQAYEFGQRAKLAEIQHTLGIRS
ncbi:hypothetical protein [Mesorhizobium sp. M7A.F.Ca.MR.362.00.0.0]|uniref:hypothetical protein n=1 Tax=Mesorhizobium sp. M7A.F.Ca.MR.362.00.0.0 TaxID=2496779 RepID=UPI000FD2ECD1|nr:hypothetical protein [Mesorhizobium sp. M7A.F.Ca.MR.362.00.0.0]RUU79734.1 hypothetical protein EOC06_14860 [Mesorhizobium sp. M7A.F.Ca.MR.362.00.0.0]RWN95492.1 MAG: hypothetical protein EOS05_11910 [Mesorhizobium sp.]